MAYDAVERLLNSIEKTDGCKENLARAELGAARTFLAAIEKYIDDANRNGEHVMNCPSEYVEGVNIGEPCNCYLQPIISALTGPTKSSELARVELTHAREALVVLEKVARTRHEYSASISCRIYPFYKCPDELCTEARQVMGK